MPIGRPSAAANATGSVFCLFLAGGAAWVVVVGGGPLLWTSLAGSVGLGVLGVVGLVDVRWPRRAGERLRSGACHVAGGLLLVGGALLDLALAGWTLLDDAIAIGAAGGLLLIVIGLVRLTWARRGPSRDRARPRRPVR